MANTTRQFGQTIQIKTGKPEKKITKTGFYIWITALWKDDIAPSPSPEYLYGVLVSHGMECIITLLYY